MSGTVIELYSDADLRRLRAQIRGWRVALGVLAAVTLAVCVALAAVTGTANAAHTEPAAVIVSTVLGWVILYCHIFVVTAKQRELTHAQMLREEERERVEGPVTVTKERLVIRKSITARRVEVRGEEGRRLLVCESRAGTLAQARATAVYAAHGYAAAYEVEP